MTPFDPYHVWLGIPPAEQPPSHYRLLAIAPLEDSPDVIENAAERQMAHVRRAATGKHAEASQKILNEIAAARRCLLDAQQKAQYDARWPMDQSPAPPGIAATMEWTPPRPPKPPLKPPPRAKVDEPAQRWKGVPSGESSHKSAAVDTVAPPRVVVTIPASESPAVSRARGSRKRPPWMFVMIAGLALLPIVALVVALAVMAHQSSLADAEAGASTPTQSVASSGGDMLNRRPTPPGTSTIDDSRPPLPSPGGDTRRPLNESSDDRDPFDESPSRGPVDDKPALTRTLTVSAKKSMIQLALFRLPAHAATGVQLKAGQVVKLNISGQCRIGFQAYDIRGPEGLLVAIGQTDAPATQYYKGAAELDFTVDKSGQLFLAVDDLIQADNQGELTVEVTVYD